MTSVMCLKILDYDVRVYEYEAEHVKTPFGDFMSPMQKEAC